MLQTAVADSDQAIAALEDDTKGAQHRELVDVVIASKGLHTLWHVNEIQTHMNDVIQTELYLKRARERDAHNLAWDLNEHRNETLSKIGANSVLYRKLLEQAGSASDEAIKAYVTFRSQEGRARALKYFKPGCGEGFVDWFCCFCGGSKRRNDRRLNGKRIVVTPSVEPQTINWHNFGVSQSDQRNKNCILYLLLLVMMFFCVQGVILYQEEIS